MGGYILTDENGGVVIVMNLPRRNVWLEAIFSLGLWDELVVSEHNWGFETTGERLKATASTILRELTSGRYEPESESWRRWEGDVSTAEVLRNICEEIMRKAPDGTIYVLDDFMTDWVNEPCPCGKCWHAHPEEV